MQLTRKTKNLDVTVNVAQLRLANKDTNRPDDDLSLPVHWLASGPRPKASDVAFSDAREKQEQRILRALHYGKFANPDNLQANPIIERHGQTFYPFFACDRVIGYINGEGQWLGHEMGYHPNGSFLPEARSPKLPGFYAARDCNSRLLRTKALTQVGCSISVANLARPFGVGAFEAKLVAYPVIDEYAVVGYIPVNDDVSIEELPQKLRWQGDTDTLGRREDGAWILHDVPDDYHALQPRFHRGCLYLPLMPPPGAPQQKNFQFVAIRDFVSDKALSGEPYGNEKRVWGCKPFIAKVNGFAVVLHPEDPRCRIDGCTPLIDTDGVAIGFANPVTFQTYSDSPEACPDGILLSRNPNGTVSVTPFRGLLLGPRDDRKLLEGSPVPHIDEPKLPDESNNQNLGNFAKRQSDKIMKFALDLTVGCRPLEHAGQTYYPLVNGKNIIGFLNDDLEWYPLTFAPGGYDFSKSGLCVAERTDKDGETQTCFITPATYAEPVWDASGDSILAFPVLDEGNIKGYVPAAAHLSLPNGLLPYEEPLHNAKRRNTDGAWELRPRPNFLEPRWRGLRQGHQVPVIAPTDTDKTLRGAPVVLRAELKIQDRAWRMSYKQDSDGFRVVYRPDRAEGEEIDYFPLADSKQQVVALVNAAGDPHPSTPLPFGARAAYDETVRAWRLYSPGMGNYASLDDFAGLVAMPALTFKERLTQCKLTTRDIAACTLIVGLGSAISVSVGVGLAYRARSAPGEDPRSEWLTEIIDWFNGECFSDYFASSGRSPDLVRLKAIADATFRDVATRLNPEDFGCPSNITDLDPAHMYAAAREYLANVTQSVANMPAPAASASSGSSHALLVTALLVMLHMLGFFA